MSRCENPEVEVSDSGKHDACAKNRRIQPTAIAILALTLVSIAICLTTFYDGRHSAQEKAIHSYLSEGLPYLAVGDIDVKADSRASESRQVFGVVTLTLPKLSLFASKDRAQAISDAYGLSCASWGEAKKLTSKFSATMTRVDGAAQWKLTSFSFWDTAGGCFDGFNAVLKSSSNRVKERVDPAPHG